jgi:hypothetical protein
MYRRIATTLATALAALTLAACNQPAPVSPLPAASPTPPATTEVPASTAPPPTTTPDVETSGVCQGIVRYTMDGADTADRPVGVCLRVGSILRIENTFPNATPSPANRATCRYEAGVVECRLIRAGNVTITFGQGADRGSVSLLVIA